MTFNMVIRELNQLEHNQLQECLIKMYSDIKFVCDKYNLTVFLGGGSALGAMRHKGFIPWDDDLDLNMPREDYDKLVKIINKELGNEYYCSAPNTKLVEAEFLKVYKKDTINREVYSHDKNVGVWIDIFPIDGAPRHKIMQKLKGFISDLFYFFNVSLYISQRDNELVKQAYKDKHRLGRYYTAKVIGKIFPIDYKNFYGKFDNFVSKNCKDCKYLTVATGRNKYAEECILRKDIFPAKKVEFEGISVNVYNNVEKYLTNLYGNYMQIPPPEKREKHYVSEFHISDKVKWHTVQAEKYHLERK